MCASSRKQAEPRGVLVAARAFEDAAAVVHDVRGDVNLGVRPVDERAVHPDFAGAGKAISDSCRVRGSAPGLLDTGVVSVSPLSRCGCGRRTPVD